MTIRNREETLGPITGTYVYSSTTRVKNSFWEKKYSTDVADNPGGDNPLLLKRLNPCIGVVSGTAGGGAFSSWPLTAQYVSSHVDSNPTYSDYVTQVMARTNPATSTVDLPTFIAEMRDLPGLLKQPIKLLRERGRSLLKKGAETNLSYQFGWKPLLGDLRKIYNFQKYVDQRVIEFNSLKNSGGLKRKAHISKSVVVGSTRSVYLHSSLSLWIRSDITDTTERELWGTCRWVPNHDWANRLLAQTGPNSHRRHIIKYVLGLDLSQMTSSLWEALPWSWLIDWFADVGDYLQASNNSVAHVSGAVSIMETATTTRDFTITSKPSGITVSDLSSVYVTKTRSCHAPIPRVICRPFLSGRRLSILGSLAILKGHK